MALLDNVFKQRMVGALVLIALAVVFLPMLFSRPDELREVRVNAPSAPVAPVVPDVSVQPAAVPDAPPPTVVEDAAPATAPSPAPAPAPAITAKAPAQAHPPSMPIASAPTVTAPAAGTPAVAQPKVAPQAATPAPTASANKLDGSGVPVSWSVQLASLSSRAGADTLQKTLRAQGYNAYVRSADGKNRVFVGPLIDRAEAERLRDVINRQQNLKGFVVRFEPERT
ncbi:SPOR domain-containing protein [Pseudomonas japonica]|uniref:SPOR domain-containing protein n=1 Tax=Pseudomonas japonica TaxID=256466 RepID=UPI0015E290BF|nr:SPOR domain-containing protein [Pseudomonas japonica]MBA1291299.1 SPOR domain-containing protein [Pseudomonas japonica]